MPTFLLAAGGSAWGFYAETIGIYLRHSTREKDGKTHVYWRLVRSVRRNGKVVQQTVTQLGELDAAGRARARLLAQRIAGEAGQRELFEEEPEEMTVAVRLDRVRLERDRAFGDVYLGWKLWCGLELDQQLARLLPAGRDGVPWATMAALLVLARLCEPSSELAIAERWYRGTAQEEMLGVSATAVNDDRLYRALDRLLPHKGALESHLRAKLGELFALDYDLLLYDVTSTYFEGLSERNPQARRGYSRDHRPDRQRVCLALVVTREGLPLGYEVFAGNRVDVTTVEEIVGTMEQRFGLGACPRSHAGRGCVARWALVRVIGESSRRKERGALSAVRRFGSREQVRRPRGESSDRMRCEFPEIARRADEAPLAGDLSLAAQKELPKTASRLRLPEDRLHGLLAEAVAASVARSAKPSVHGKRSLPERLASSRGRGSFTVFLVAGRDVAANPSLLQPHQTLLRAVVAVG